MFAPDKMKGCGWSPWELARELVASSPSEPDDTFERSEDEEQRLRGTESSGVIVYLSIMASGTQVPLGS